MPTAITKSATSTNSPTRNSVQVSCLRCAILRPLLFPCAPDYPTFTPEIASNMDLSPPQVLREFLRKILCRLAALQNAYSKLHPTHRRAVSLCSSARDASPCQNGNSPAQIHPATDA